MATEKFAPIQGSIYDLHPAFAIEAAFIRNLPEKTGKTLEEWVNMVKKAGPETLTVLIDCGHVDPPGILSATGFNCHNEVGIFIKSDFMKIRFSQKNRCCNKSSRNVLYYWLLRIIVG